MRHMKKISIYLVVAVAAFCAGTLAANRYNAPSTIVHVSTVTWKKEATPEQRKAALEGIKTMAAEVPGIKNVWIKATKVQPQERNDAFAIEFENKAAAEGYVNAPAHKAWEKIYIPYREESSNSQITN